MAGYHALERMEYWNHGVMVDKAEVDLQEFIEDLVQRGLAGYEI